jgi:transcriptional regulator with XRE-family HTH domain
MYRTTRTRLIEERKARRWSQQELADCIGTTQNNISRWELGITSPSPYFRAKLCDLLGASASDLGLTIGENGASSQPRENLNPQEAQPAEGVLRTALQETSCLWLVPYRRNPWFTGQETVLARLAHLLPATAEPLALCGMGGIGKTLLALEYAYRHALEYCAVLWIGAETEESIFSSFLRIAEILRLPERDEKDQRRIIAAVQRWLNAHSQWLLIWDNVEDLALFDRFLPATLAGTILLTTRFRVLGTLARSIDLLPMEQEEGMLFLLRRARVLAPEATGEHVRQFAEHMSAQYEACAELVVATGGLPLALDQAGAYIERTQCSLSAYLGLFRTCHATLLQQQGEGSRDHPESVSATLALAIVASTQRHPAVRDLLQVCALLQPDAIPEELFRQGATHLGPLLSAACRDSLEWDSVAAAACAYSLFRRQTEQTLSLHRLVQVVLLDVMTDEERTLWNERVIAALDVAFPRVRHTTSYDTWKQCERLLPHVLLCFRRNESISASLPLASLAYKTACYLLRRGQLGEAERLYQRVLSLREQYLGQQHPDTAQALHDLAVLRHRQGYLDEALSLAQRSLSIRSQLLGEAHPQTLASRALFCQLAQEQRCTAQESSSQQRAGETPDLFPPKSISTEASSLAQEPVTPHEAEQALLQEFIHACCELHPLAWSSAGDLWHAYEHWARDHEKLFSLTRRAFTDQLKAYGCYADRTNTTRIWRGIAIVKQECDE